MEVVQCQEQTDHLEVISVAVIEFRFEYLRAPLCRKPYELVVELMVLSLQTSCHLLSRQAQAPLALSERVPKLEDQYL